jgi:hypothetical protein
MNDKIKNLTEFVAIANNQRQQYLHAIKELEDRKQTKIELEQRKSEQLLQRQLNDLDRQLSELDSIERVFIAQNQSTQNISKIRKTIENFCDVLSKSIRRDTKDNLSKIRQNMDAEIDKYKAVEQKWIDTQKNKFNEMFNDLKKDLDRNIGSVLTEDLEILACKDLKIEGIMPNTNKLNVSEKLLTYDLLGTQYSVKVPQILPFICSNNILVLYPHTYDIKSKIQELLGRLLLSANAGNIKLLLIDLKNNGANFNDFLFLNEKKEELKEIYENEVIIHEQTLEIKLSSLVQEITDIIQDRGKSNIIQYNIEHYNDIHPLYFILFDNYPYRLNINWSKNLEKTLRLGPKAGIQTIFFASSQTGKDALNRLENTEIYTMDATDVELQQKIKDTFCQKAVEIIKNNYSTDKTLYFRNYLPIDNRLWASDSIDGLSIPVGRHRSREINLEYNNKIKTHAHIIGKSGSGKSCLLHTIVVSACLKYSPDEMEVWLLDFKAGTEFKIYQTYNLPHAKIITLKNEKEVAIHVLKLVVSEIERRGELFKKTECKDYKDYRQKSEKHVLSRILLVIDEYQLLFAEGTTRYIAERYIKDILEKGRSFGISILLSSQDAHVDSQMLNNISTRIVLMTNMGSKLLNSGNEKALRLNMGHGIFNEVNGDISGDVLFQSFYLPDNHITEKLAALSRESKKTSLEKKRSLIFDGEARANILTANLLNNVRKDICDELLFIPGEKLFLDENDYTIFFKKLSNNNLLVVPGFNYKAAIRSLYGVVVSMLPQLKTNMAHIYLMNFVSKENFIEYKAISNLNTVLSDNGFNIHYLDKTAGTNKMLDEIDSFIESSKIKAKNSVSGILVVFNIERCDSFHYDSSKDRNKMYDRNGYTDATVKLQKIMETGFNKKFFTLIQTNAPDDNGFGKVFWSNEEDDLKYFGHRIALQMSPEDSQSFVRDRNLASKLYDEELGEAGHNRCIYFDSNNFFSEKLKPFEFLSDEDLNLIIK